MARISLCSELTNSARSCRHSGEFALRDAVVRLMPSVSAMSVTGCGRCERLRDSGEAAFAAELGDGGELRFRGCVLTFHACQSGTGATTGGRQHSASAVRGCEQYSVQKWQFASTHSRLRCLSLNGTNPVIPLLAAKSEEVRLQRRTEVGVFPPGRNLSRRMYMPEEHLTESLPD